MRSLAAIGQWRREGGASREGGGRGVRADVAVAVRGQGARTGQPLESLIIHIQRERFIKS